MVYLVCVAHGYGMFVGLFAASFFVAVLSELLARIIKTPVILMLVPMLIPEIPGGDLYYTMQHLVRGEYVQFGNFSNRVMIEAGRLPWELSWPPMRQSLFAPWVHMGRF